MTHCICCSPWYLILVTFRQITRFTLITVQYMLQSKWTEDRHLKNVGNHNSHTQVTWYGACVVAAACTVNSVQLEVIFIFPVYATSTKTHLNRDGRYRGNTDEGTYSVISQESQCTSCPQQGHEGSKTLLQQNPPVLNWRCQIMQVVLCNSHRMVVAVAVYLT